jgi:hypothetical protein
MSFFSSEGAGFLEYALVKRVVPSINLEQKVMHSSMQYPSAIDPSG